jgi:hypothetical protein
MIGTSSMSVRVTGATATGTLVNQRCGSGAINLRLTPAGDVSGEATAFDSTCGRNVLSVRGRASGAQLQLNLSGPGLSGSVNLRPGSAPALPPAAAPQAPQEAPQAAAAAPTAGGLANGTYSSGMNIAAGSFDYVVYLSIKMVDGSGTGTVTNPRCGALPISLRVDSSGRIAGDMRFTTYTNCGMGAEGKVTGRVDAGKMVLEMSGTTSNAKGRATLGRTGN